MQHLCATPWTKKKGNHTFCLAERDRIRHGVIEKKKRVSQGFGTNYIGAYLVSKATRTESSFTESTGQQQGERKIQVMGHFR